MENILDQLVRGTILQAGCHDCCVFTLRALRSSPLSSQLRSLQMSPTLRLAVETPGLLDSLYFEEDCSTREPLEPHEVEIKTSHVRLNFKDLLLALGRENGKTFDNEFAGVVYRVGALAEFSPGDRVCRFSPTAFWTYTRVADSSLAHVPLNIPVTHTAAVLYYVAYKWHKKKTTTPSSNHVYSRSLGLIQRLIYSLIRQWIYIVLCVKYRV